MPKFKNSNETFWVIFKQCECIIKIFNETLTIFKGIKDIAENALNPFSLEKNSTGNFTVVQN